MKKNDLLRNEDTVLRVLDIKADKVLVIDCIKRTMPKWITTAALENFKLILEENLHEITGVEVVELDALEADARRFAYEHYTIIAGILPFIGDKRVRCQLIDDIATEKGISKKTITNYLCLYLAFQDVSALAPKQNTGKNELTQDKKNMRWALNKFFYNKNKNSLTTAYTLMLKEKYCDANGILVAGHPSIYQFRYFYNKTKNMQTYYISRNGMKDYQRNNRPLLGDGTQEYAPAVGVGMLDSTICGPLSSLSTS